MIYNQVEFAPILLKSAPLQQINQNVGAIFQSSVMSNKVHLLPYHKVGHYHLHLRKYIDVEQILSPSQRVNKLRLDWVLQVRLRGMLIFLFGLNVYQ